MHILQPPKSDTWSTMQNDLTYFVLKDAVFLKQPWQWIDKHTTNNSRNAMSRKWMIKCYFNKFPFFLSVLYFKEKYKPFVKDLEYCFKPHCMVLYFHLYQFHYLLLMSCPSHDSVLLFIVSQCGIHLLSKLVFCSFESIVGPDVFTA